MGRKKTTVGKIRDCLVSIKMWDDNPIEGADYNKKIFVEALKAHLEYADEYGEVIPEDLKIKAEIYICVD